MGGGSRAVADALGCSIPEARKFVEAYANGFKGITKFKQKGSSFVRSHGYIVICQYTGHKLYWEDWKKWYEMEQLDDYELYSKYPEEAIREHRSAAAKWDRLALNTVTQGTGIIILKTAVTMFFKWIVQNKLFNKVLICDLVHDEVCIEYPEELRNTVVMKLKECMEKAASVFCPKLPIPAEPETGTFWIH